MNTEIKIDYYLAGDPFTYDEEFGCNMFDVSKTALSQEMAQLEEARIKEIEADLKLFHSETVPKHMFPIQNSCLVIFGNQATKRR